MPASGGARRVIERRRAQRSFGDGLIAAEVGDLHEAWMRQADRVLEDPQIVAAVYEALARRHPKSRSRGRLGSPAEVAARSAPSCVISAAAPNSACWRSPGQRAARCLTLARSRYKGDEGMKRWVGLGVIADNLVNIGRALAKPPAP
jgi:hypothetical protein